MKAKYSNASQSKPSPCSARQHERGVADPGVAVVPVALAARRLGERRRGRGHDRPGRRVAEPLECERAALDVGPEGVVGERGHAHPLAPEVLGLRELAERLVDGVRSVAAPRERDERGLTVFERGPAVAAGTEDPERERALHRELDTLVGDDELVVALAVVAPSAGGARVVEHGDAVGDDLDPAAEARRDPQQRPLRGRVAGYPADVGAAVADVGRAHDEHVLHGQPAGGRVPGRLQHHRPGHVAAGVRHHRVRRAEAERARGAVEQCPEHARRVRAGEAQPLDRAVGGDERAHLAVGEERVLGDRGEDAHGGAGTS